MAPAPPAGEAAESRLYPLWLTETYPPSRGGMAQSCDRIVEGLRGAGIDVDVVHLDRQPAGVSRPRMAQRRRGRDLRWPVEGDPAHALRCLWNRLAADSRERRYTHVVAFGGLLPLLAAPVFAAWLPAPLVTLVRGNDLDIGLFHPQRADIVHRALAASAAVCAVSGDKARHIAALVPSCAPAVIPNGIDLARWQPLAADLARAADWRRATLGDGEVGGGGAGSAAGAARKRVLGFFGHVKRKKGALFLLDNLRRAGLTGRFHVRFVGELETEVAAWLERHGGAVSHDVEPFGDRYGLLARYPACDLVALPSFYDGTPNVMVEAAALGIPMLAARTGGMADLLEDGRHAFLFAPGSDEDAVAALRRAAAAEDADLARMGDSCRELALDRLDHRRETAAYVEVLRAVGTSRTGTLPAE